MRWLAYKGTVWLARLILAPFVRVRVLHGERSRVTGACILACNHISHFDPPLIAARIHRKVDWMAVAELFSIPFLGSWLRFVHAFPIDRARGDAASVRVSLQRLKLGRVLGIFPDGGIRDGAASIVGGAAPVPGIGALAQISGAPVLPCVILGSDRLYARRSYLPFRRAPVWIGFGEPLHCEGREKAERIALDNRLAESLRSIAREMTAHFDLSEADLPKPPRERMAT
jgi:1-acyl-sn-glycerol-3-phosphate acyltransferase